MAKYSIDLIKEAIARKGIRSLVLFTKLKALYVSGHIKDFNGTIKHTRFGYATRKPFIADLKRLHDMGFLKAKDRRVKHGIVTDVVLLGVRTIRKKLINKTRRSTLLVFDPESKILREQFQAAVVQDMLCKQAYKAARSSKNNGEAILLIEQHQSMGPLPLSNLAQSYLPKVSFKTLARKLGYYSQATAYKVMERLCELGYLKKYNQLKPVIRGMRFKEWTNVKVECNVYEVLNSILPRKTEFMKLA